ncbi:hypothetical protein OIO90_001830 [Microbotryomycetes sp. JL221]|nr:hypothetical protein OIO90_001830 [Microbotryomycetes sp. JL221]
MDPPKLAALPPNEVRAITSTLMTEHFRWAPETFAKEGMDIANESLYTASSRLEQALQTLVQGHTGDNNPSDQSRKTLDFTDDDVQKGVYRLETLLETSIDKHFDLFEIFVLRNTFNVPVDFVPHIILEHQRRIDPSLQSQDAQTIAEYEEELIKLEIEVTRQRELEGAAEAAARDGGFFGGSASVSDSAQGLKTQVAALHARVASLLDTPAAPLQGHVAAEMDPWATRANFVNWAAQAKTDQAPTSRGDGDLQHSVDDNAGSQSDAQVRPSRLSQMNVADN